MLFLFLLLLIVAGMIWYADPFRLFSPVPYDVTASPVSLVQPGTVVGNTAPEGWTHLILKSRPRVSSGAVSRLRGWCRADAPPQNDSVTPTPNEPPNLSRRSPRALTAGINPAARWV